ncbi:MBL fold metallo-hydrolase [Desulfobotulus sp. H1]|uniref:MBL fold metallo-hydrolase n=1 Tax=Desulfobotulus pelophilus TaxID=2823377 RepID=A0ABT3NAW6_9BACT|nr:MBL fold metallo-hydrolase [Desulfobotulus pelophilus]MCW7754597.1 MBL fold metallo-hydrolase [Desulfobotulus pelophilus]
MRIILLGSGTCVPRLDRACSALLVEVSGLKILVDCGLGTMHRLLAAGTEPSDVDLLFLTHFHPDHTGELVSLLFSGKYAGARGRSKKLVLAGGKGLGEFCRGLGRVYGEWVDGGGLLEVKEIPMVTQFLWSVGEVQLGCTPVNHRPESLAISVGHHGRRLVVSGDTDICPPLAAFSSGADLLVCEAAMPDSMKVDGHLTPALAGALAQEAGVAKLVLTHLYPECEGTDVVAGAKRFFDGSVWVASDLMTLDL